ncbi:unnamed protein product [Clonostachys rhizophaga]|uniref:Uncharacterized protein n=1 Tax=Clonostachys rhizophaga TaxID=160324 RepID=A0A9N9W127_9HYPO|nr:unnamed protein product [Clonostachys rhizophaga]
MCGSVMSSQTPPTRAEYLAQPEIKELLEKRPEIKAFIDAHPEIVLGREAYDVEDKKANAEHDDEVFDDESKPFPEMVLIQKYYYSTRPDAKAEDQNKRVMVAAVINDDYIEKRFQAIAQGPKDGNQYDDPEGCLKLFFK